MIHALFAQKVGMTHVYNDKNRHVPVTILSVAKQAITAVRLNPNQPYASIQIGAVGRKTIKKPQMGQINKTALPIAHRREVRMDSQENPSQIPVVGTVITADIFSVGDTIKVSAISKGKGFAGTIKRHNFSRGPQSHGSKNVRKPGSIGGGYPQRVLLGRQMPGHMGAKRVTTRGLKIVAINPHDNTIAVSGAVPGPNKGRIFVEKTS